MTQIFDSIKQLDAMFVDLSQIGAEANYQPILQDFQQNIAAGESASFSTQHEPSGAAWAPLVPSTLKRKGTSTILFETGALMASLVSLGGPGNLNATTSRSLLFGTDVEYSIFHQQGTSKMVSRPPVGMSEETLQMLANKVANSTVVQLKWGY